MTPSTPPPTDPDASPCVGQCALDPASICLGCGRHIDEIIAWPGATPATREQIRARAAARQAARGAPG
jgi:predicted Fe-S protein YdhL (DUF1289 family)